MLYCSPIAILRYWKFQVPGLIFVVIAAQVAVPEFFQADSQPVGCRRLVSA